MPLTTFPPVTWPNVDPDLAAVPLVSTALEVDEVALLGAVFTNTSGVGRKITITDTAGLAVLFEVDIPESGVPSSFEWPLLRLTGLKWLADGAGVVGKIWGWK